MTAGFSFFVVCHFHGLFLIWSQSFRRVDVDGYSWHPYNKNQLWDQVYNSSKRDTLLHMLAHVQVTGSASWRWASLMHLKVFWYAISTDRLWRCVQCAVSPVSSCFTSPWETWEHEQPELFLLHRLKSLLFTSGPGLVLHTPVGVYEHQDTILSFKLLFTLRSWIFTIQTMTFSAVEKTFLLIQRLLISSCFWS